MFDGKDFADGAEDHRLVALEKVQGASVYSALGEKLGDLAGVIINQNSGMIAYVVVSFGGLLGLGKKRIVLPWSVLNYDSELRGYVVNANQSNVRSLQPSKADWGIRLDPARSLAEA